jgi:hypothetical protein
VSRTSSSRSRALKEAILRGADDYLVLVEEAELLDLCFTIAERKELLPLACGELGFARHFDRRHTPKLASAQPFVCQQAHAGGVGSARSVLILGTFSTALTTAVSTRRPGRSRRWGTAC